MIGETTSAPCVLSDQSNRRSFLKERGWSSVVPGRFVLLRRLVRWAGEPAAATTLHGFGVWREASHADTEAQQACNSHASHRKAFAVSWFRQPCGTRGSGHPGCRGA